MTEPRDPSPVPDVDPAVDRADGGPRAEVVAAVTAFAHTHLEAEFAGNGNLWNREIVAASNWLPPSLAHRFARSTNPRLRGALAGNPATAPALLATFLTDDQGSVARRALTNPSTPYPDVEAAADLLGQLSLAHPDCPPDTLEAALADENHRATALAHPNLPAHHVHELAATLATTTTRGTDRRTLLESPHLTHTEAAALLYGPTPAPSHYEWVWANNPNADPAWLAEYAERRFSDPDQGAIARLAQHPSTPAAVLARIATGHANARYALSNPHCPAGAFRSVLAAKVRNPDGSTQTTNCGLLCDMATNPSCPVDVLDAIPAAVVSGAGRRYDFILAHARTGEQARTLLTLIRTGRAPSGSCSMPPAPSRRPRPETPRSRQRRPVNRCPPGTGRGTMRTPQRAQPTHRTREQGPSPAACSEV